MYYNSCSEDSQALFKQRKLPWEINSVRQSYTWLAGYYDTIICVEKKEHPLTLQSLC